MARGSQEGTVMAREITSTTQLGTPERTQAAAPEAQAPAAAPAQGARRAPGQFGAPDILALQRAVGNRAAQTLLPRQRARGPAVNTGQPAAIQLMRYDVGIGEHYNGWGNDVLATTSLANCICIVAQETVGPSFFAAMYHHNTGPDFDGEQWNPARLLVTKAELLEDVGNTEDNVRFTVSLGAVWQDVERHGTTEQQKKDAFFMRHGLIQMIQEIFHTTPTQAGATAVYDIATRMLTVA
jgi:hypothetical protein